MNQLLLQLADTLWPKVILLGLILMVGYWLAVYDDGTQIGDAVLQIRQQVSAAEKQLQATKDAVANADRFEKEIAETAKQFERISDFMPDRMGVADLMKIISETASSAGVKVMKTSPVSGQNAGGALAGSNVDFYETTRIGFTLEGDFTQVVTFLSKISHEPKLLTFDKVSIVAGKAGDSTAPRLTFTGDLVGYRYLRKAEISDTAVGGANGQL